jgi:hypothetical protein
MGRGSQRSSHGSCPVAPSALCDNAQVSHRAACESSPGRYLEVPVWHARCAPDVPSWRASDLANGWHGRLVLGGRGARWYRRRGVCSRLASTDCGCSSAPPRSAPGAGPSGPERWHPGCSTSPARRPALVLAQYPHVAVKATSLPSYVTEAYPHPGLHTHPACGRGVWTATCLLGS